MPSANFDFLRPKRPYLADLGAFAEEYAHPDPAGALVKLRVFAEYLVAAAFHELGLSPGRDPRLADLLEDRAFLAVTPTSIATKLHAVRQAGNRAAHGGQVDTRAALAALQHAYDLGAWFAVRFDKLPPAATGSYRPPSGSLARVTKEALRKAQQGAEERLRAQEALVEKLLADIAAERARSSAAEEAAKKTQAEIDDLLLEGMRAATVLELSEEQTRKQIIDADLVEAGWDVGPGGVSTDRVGQEVEVDGQPTASGKGKADYVLWGEDGKPLAVIEAKKASKDAALGKTQAALYAGALQKKHGVRPVIYYSNGMETFLWDDALGEPPRKVYGFHSPTSLATLHFQRKHRVDLATVTANPKIVDRLYQIEAVKRVCERFAENHRRALLVLATGTGKTRVAIALCDVLARARWSSRILFLCDRRELRKQADDAFQEHLPGEPRTLVTEESAGEKKHRVYLATYPAMMKWYASFDAGFFDLVIADESHRSIYNRYGDLFRYFDARVVGLTATPRGEIHHQTYALFGCPNGDPTAAFSLSDALAHVPPYLVPPRMVAHTTQFLRKGIQGKDLTAEQREELRDAGLDPDAVHIDAADVDRQIFNKDTTREILRNLMENGIRDASGSRLGKTILFARSQAHARHIEEIFVESYPQYGGGFLAVIVHEDARADALLGAFKDPKKEPTIAVSVDMLDTGIDVPEIVNLVFARPVESRVKFWQMLGRGTRLRRDLFGPGQDKSCFLVFDHWGNAKHFDEQIAERDVRPPRSPQEQRFEARVELCQAALDAFDRPAFERGVDLLAADIAALAGLRALSVRDRWREIQAVSAREALLAFDPVTKATLLGDIAPLMQWVDIRGAEDAARFDTLVARLEAERLRKSSRAEDLQGDLEGRVARLPTNLTQVQAKGPVILRVRDRAFWAGASFADLEVLREELRGIMHLAAAPAVARPGPRTIDVSDGGVRTEEVKVQLQGAELAEYRRRVEGVLRQHFHEHPTLVKIRAGVPVSAYDLEDLTKLVLELDPKVDLRDLLLHYPEAANHLEYALRGIVGMDPAVVDGAFTRFVVAHPELTAQQLRFLSMLKQHLATYGFVLVDKLYDKPFTSLHAEGIEGVFPDGRHIDDILDILGHFNPPPELRASAPPPEA